MEATRIRLAEGVHLTYLPARKFKTSLLSAQFVTPLRRETAGANALLAAVLRRGTVSCPDMGALSAKMDNLYDASIDYTVRKKGENQCVGFVASFIDDRYAPGGERLLEPAAALLGELVCDHVVLPQVHSRVKQHGGVAGQVVPALDVSLHALAMDGPEAGDGSQRDAPALGLLHDGGPQRMFRGLFQTGGHTE